MYFGLINKKYYQRQSYFGVSQNMLEKVKYIFICEQRIMQKAIEYKNYVFTSVKIAGNG